MRMILLLSLLITGCVTRGEIRASLWENNGLPDDLCEKAIQKELRSPQAKRLWDHGFYRRLNNGKFEFIPFCDLELSLQMQSIIGADLNEILDKTLPKAD